MMKTKDAFAFSDPCEIYILCIIKLEYGLNSSMKSKLYRYAENSNDCRNNYTSMTLSHAYIKNGGALCCLTNRLKNKIQLETYLTLIK